MNSPPTSRICCTSIPNKRSRNYDRTELWLNDDIRASETFGSLRTLAKAMQVSAEKAITCNQELVGYLESIEGAAEPQREIASVAMDLKDLVGAVEVIFGEKSDSYAYAAELCRKKDKQTDKLEALVVNVGEALEDKLYSQTKSVVFASATLSIDGDFTSFENAMGLNAGEDTRARTCQLDSSYDFDKNMTVYVANDIPEPSDPHYIDELERLLVGTHIAPAGVDIDAVHQPARNGEVLRRRSTCPQGRGFAPRLSEMGSFR